MALCVLRTVMDTTWQDVVDKVRPYVTRIATPDGSGTGFMVFRSSVSPLCGIATAAHVIDHAHYWEQPIRITQYESGKSTLLRVEDRAIFLDESRDTAIIIVDGGLLPLPSSSPQLWFKDKFVRVGNEIGWLGFPSVASDQLCFFSGRISCYIGPSHSYLVDGVAINGVSGGPAFFPINGFHLVGVVSAYMPNRSTGVTLPGLSVVQDVSHLQDLVERFQSVDEAKKKETQANEVQGAVQKPEEPGTAEK
jgi:hypothetical protein